MANNFTKSSATFGTLPVFMTAISTILGAILFLRFGWAVGNVGLIGIIGIIILGHMVTIPTAMAVAEIATNQKVLGGGAYYIISRSFGLNIGAAIGITLYLSQAISVAFYIIAFAEAFDPVIQWVANDFGWLIYDKRAISVPAMMLLSGLFLWRGSNVGMKVLYVVVGTLAISLFMFFIGSPTDAPQDIVLDATIENPKSFFYVFTIIFPAFTGLAAGLGLSGELKNPKKSIPRGTIWATVGGLIIYLFAAYKFTVSASPEDLDSNQLIMSNIAIWGPIIPIGLAAASLSSALGSIMVAPRTLQAIGMDDIFPQEGLNKWLKKENRKTTEPLNASVISIVIAFIFILIGDVDFVAQIISMFFMVTYGAICMISFLEHFAADPSYRPTFRSRWYLSLMGAILSFWIMFQMNMVYAIVSLLIMGVIYYGINVSNKEHRGLAKLFRGVVFQLSRYLQIFAQRAEKVDREVSWRPFAICISQDTFKRRSAFDLLRWISYKYGFGTYIHYLEGFLNEKTNDESKNVMKRLIHLASGSRNRVFLDTIISPSMTSAIAQVMQLSGISGHGYNSILFEYSRTKPKQLNYVIDNYELIESTQFDVCVLNTSYKGFGYHKEIHIWIGSKDYENANLMILLAYIIQGHPDWKKSMIKIFAMYPEKDLEVEQGKLLSLIRSGQLPISSSNIELIGIDHTDKKKEIMNKSMDADLTILGFNREDVDRDKLDMFTGFDDMGNILFVSSYKKIKIK
ncbi:amino acid permease [Ancylomarina euxinus]|uniref:Amino acid permease n=1 Tax=Ancylomarina euxinus TaxID=2283627 RepID=A0A425Y311_9BACT|nr:amino acid permease [Ancylomarina euxinus]MCZ4693154.1 amino acid permease [Ancylomarina euxinus]MUP15292.1 amino acid permease [Ancylomarina euxinus]RRG22578.1 amino acid permease [Ancylomarina euxinus]